MPKLMNANDEMVVMNIPGAGSFQFSAIRPNKLGATEYTLVTIVVDVTGSVQNFADQLLTMVRTVVDACKKSQRAENLMIRLISFNTKIEEIHGFKTLRDIDPAKYNNFQPYGATALYDASYSAIGATITYGQTLVSQDFDVNGAIYIITDGDDNASKITPRMIKKQLDTLNMDESLESLITVLVGIKDPAVTGEDWGKHISKRLSTFKDGSGLSQYIDAGDATPGKLAKLANFVSRSISSQSQSLGTGGPSQQLVF